MGDGGNGRKGGVRAFAKTGRLPAFEIGAPKKGVTAMRTLTFAGVLCLMTSLWVFAQDHVKTGTDEGRILALETAWNHAEESKDAAALDQLLAPSLAYVDYDGSIMNKKEFLASVQRESLHPAQITNEEMNAKVYGEAAVVTGIYREKGTSKGKPYQRRGRFTDTWVKQGGTWQCVASQSTLISR
jgi:ketosteroid isomerase-like protein